VVASTASYMVIHS